LASGNEEAQCALGKALLELGQLQESIEALRKAADLNPKDPSTYFLLARAFAKVQNQAEAAKALQQFTELKKQQGATGGMAYRPN
jgi:Flp pilus assembly protein TadD